VSGFNDSIIAEFREHGGLVRTAGFGRGLVLLHTVGAKSGEPRVGPVAAIPEGASWLIIASAGGSPKHPGWYFNLRAQPDVSVEVPATEGGGVRSVDVRAFELDGDDYEAAWQRFLERSSAFGQYATRTQGRRMPIFRLRPRD
jgi:deazaflavin-dependent oxidoreductase (nitroreductase family)